MARKKAAPAREEMVLEEVQDSTGPTLEVGLILTTFLLLGGGLAYLVMLLNERYWAK